MLKTLMIRCALLAFAFAMSLTAQAYASDPKRFDVPAGDLAAALQALAKQSGVELVYQSKQLEGLRTKGLKGSFTPEDAVTKLLEGTPLTFRKDPSGAMLIAPPRLNPLSSVEEREGPAEREGEGTPVPAGEREKGEGKRWWQRLAQANPSPGTGEGGTAQRAMRSGESSDTNSQELPAPEETGKAIPEILVKGSRSLNVDIERTRDDAQPYVTYGSEEIARSMASNVEDFLRTRLPMNAAVGGNSQNGPNPFGNQSAIDLRGLGPNQTLILVDGRRMPGSFNAVDYNQPDINGIPVSAIERIEVLPSTAGGIYGGGATAGVVNIILKRNYSGFELQATYGNTFDANASERRIDANAGFNLEGGRTNVMLVASYTESDPLQVGDRDFARRARERLYANNPTTFTNLTTPPVGYTSNIRSANGSNLVLDNLTPLNSPITFVPIGYAGVSSDGGASLVANAGRYNLDLPRDTNGAAQSLYASPTIKSAMVNVRREFHPNVEGFLDAAWLDNQGSFFTAGVPNSVQIAANAPNNPFTTAIRVRFPATGLLYPLESETETTRATAGVILRLPHEWTAEADYAWSRSKTSSSQTGPAAGDPDGTGPGIPVTTALSNGTLDVLRDLNAAPLDYTQYLLPSPNNIYGPADVTLRDATIRLSGPVMRLPGGAITVSTLFESRTEELDDTFRDTISASAVPSASFMPSRKQNIDSLYLEARVPLFSEANAVTAIRALEVTGSIRRDSYRTKSPDPQFVAVPSRSAPLPAFTFDTNKVAATDYTFSLRYSPIHDVTLRGSYGTGFLPPSIGQIVGFAPFSFTENLTDPKRGGANSTVGPYLQTTGGNPDLVPEDSNSWSAGFILTPRILPGLRLSADYTHITKSNEILSFPGTQSIVNLEDFFPGRVTRNPLTPGDQALGYTGGTIGAIDATAINVSATKVDAYDFQIDYARPTTRFGDFQFYLLATWQPHRERQAVPGSVPVDFVGFTAGQIEWRGNAGLDWKRGALTLGWNAQYYDDYRSYTATDDAAGIARTTLNQGSATIPSQIYHDVYAIYRFGAHAEDYSVFANIDVSAGLRNVFDGNPPIVAATGATLGYSTFGDPRLRSYWLSVRKRL